MSDDRIQTLHPDPQKQGVRILTSIYEPVCAAVLEAVGDDGIAWGDLTAAVEARTDPELWTSSSVGWFTITVKLDLEARGWIERSGSPQFLTLTDAGRAEFASRT